MSTIKIHVNVPAGQHYEQYTIEVSPKILGITEPMEGIAHGEILADFAATTIARVHSATTNGNTGGASRQLPIPPASNKSSDALISTGSGVADNEAGKWNGQLLTPWCKHSSIDSMDSIDPSTPAIKASQFVKVNVIDFNTNDRTSYYIRKDQRVHAALRAFADQEGSAVKDLEMFYDGEKTDAADTPKSVSTIHLTSSKHSLIFPSLRSRSRQASLSSGDDLVLRLRFPRQSDSRSLYNGRPSPPCLYLSREHSGRYSSRSRGFCLHVDFFWLHLRSLLYSSTVRGVTVMGVSHRYQINWSLDKQQRVADGPSSHSHEVP